MTWQAIPPRAAVVASYKETSPEGLQAIIASAHQAYVAWRSTSFKERAAFMHRASDVLRGNLADRQAGRP